LQKEVKDTTGEIERLMTDIDYLSNEMLSQYDVYEATSDPDTRTKIHKVPGEKIHKLMTSWAEEPVFNDKDIEKWRDDYW
jgi:hypothetical protein